ncbi:putative transcriptional regulator YvhJ [Caloramator mitchellensis]|uniref:Putative transcriptional regulator YvhJ n=1 Tax=Caloramator mitchellensis TaxID=908809 RepID=A0A0R3JX74_CALMK|nr:LCP family protein [Caloramator mitchellensis]KRQ88160.1 putative transcriptional regulator YvhJ [Caloramator mitchellensis]
MAKKKFLKKLIISLLTIIVLTGGLVFGYGLYYINKVSEHEPVKDFKIKKPVNVLLLGVDIGDPNNKNTSHKRSDTMMLVRFDPVNNKVFMLSIPRDTRVKINGEYKKINFAHSIGGIGLAIETVENLLDLTIDYYFEVDYEGFRQAIDSIGGVDVIIPRDMNYDSHDIKIHFKKGEKVHLNGELAEKFVRWRKNNDGTGYAMGDLGRISTQQEFLKLILDKLKTPSGIIRIPSLIKTVATYSKTNISPKAMIYYTYKMLTLDKNSIENQILKGEAKYISGISYFVYDGEDAFLSNFRNPNKNVQLVILNSTKVNGLAKRYKEKLIHQGFIEIETGNYESKLENSEIRANDKYIAEEIKGILNFGDIKVLDDGQNSKVVIILGQDAVK